MTTISSSCCFRVVRSSRRIRVDPGPEQHLVDPDGSLLLGASGVHIAHRRLDAPVSQRIAYFRQSLVLVTEERAIAMPQIVKTNPG